MKKVLTVLATVASTLTLYRWLHEYATVERGYEALGGEVFAFFLPLIIWVIVRNAKDSVGILEDNDEE